MLQEQNVTNIDIIATCKQVVNNVLRKRIVEDVAVYTVCPSEVSMHTIYTHPYNI